MTMFKKYLPVLKLFTIGFLAFIVAFLVTDKIHAKSLGYRWYDKGAYVKFDCNFNSTWKNEIQNSFNSWNNVNDATTGSSVAQMLFTADGNSSSNDIYEVNTSSYTWQAKM